ncbi:MAG: T9SS type A sorting domain-containing protein [Bacteroidales bacterium]
MKIFLLFILLSFLVSSTYAQVFETLQSDNYLKVLEDTVKRSMISTYTYSDYRKDAFHVLYLSTSSDTTHSLIIDDNLNIIDNKILNNVAFPPVFFCNNKIYKFWAGVAGTYPSSYFTFISLITLDSLGDIIRTDTIMREADDTIKWEVSYDRKLMLDDKNFLIAVRELNDTDGYYSFRTDKLKIIKFDTLGNVLKTKIYYSSYQDYDIVEMPNNIMLSIVGGTGFLNMYDKNKIYYLNKETLEPEDSIMGYFTRNMTKINDSLFAFHNSYAQLLRGYPADTVSNICLMNINNKRHINIDLRYYTDFSSNSINMSFESQPMVKVIDFKTTDSIYACYLMRDGYYSYCDIEICNFNINGDTNFTNRINLSTGGFKQIQGIHATNDGGILLLAFSLDDGYIGKHSTWILKYHPNGLINIRNIETGEKETIKVYPNPARDYINVDIESTNFKQSHIELYDMQGKLVKKAKLKSKQENRVDVSNLNAGAYTYNVSLNAKTISGKIIVGK